MTNRFETFLMVAIVILILMLIDIAGGAYYQELKRYRSHNAYDARTIVTVAPQARLGIDANP